MTNFKSVRSKITEKLTVVIKTHKKNVNTEKL